MAERTTPPTPTAVVVTPPADKPVRSPAPRWVRAAVAGAFILIWLIAVIVDFFVDPTMDTVPLWFQATGLLVLGYLLGVSLDDLRGSGSR